MDERQKQILSFLINQYIRSAVPVGSALLTQGSGMDLSPATFRNELAKLEEEGYLAQPHTSAGRVPTQKAYEFYVQEILHKKHYQPKTNDELRISLKKDLETDEVLKQVAHQLVAQSDQAVIVAMGEDQVFYTGLSKLFAHPEFANQQEVISVTSVIDKLDHVIGDLLKEVEDLQILIGKQNPFGEHCSSILGKYRMKNGKEGLFAIVGPMRMNYEKNIHLISEVRNLLEGK